MKKRHSARLAIAGLCAVFGLFTAACTTPPPPPAPVNWSFRGTSIRVNNSQDEVCVVFCVNSEDEPYLYQISFRVKIGQPGSAQASASRGSELPELEAGDSLTLTGGQQAAVNFNNIQPLDVVTALNPANKLEVFGTYTWAAEADLINSIGPGADAVADSFRNALNSTLAASTIPQGDPNGTVSSILNLLINNAGAALKILVSNLPCLGTCDDVLGGAVYIGIGVNGTLGGIIDSVINGQSIPAIDMGGLDHVPPSIVGGGLFTLTGAKSFVNTFPGADGSHTYNFLAGPA